MSAPASNTEAMEEASYLLATSLLIPNYVGEWGWFLSLAFEPLSATFSTPPNTQIRWIGFWRPKISDILLYLVLATIYIYIRHFFVLFLSCFSFNHDDRVYVDYGYLSCLLIPGGQVLASYEISHHMFKTEYNFVDSKSFFSFPY
jgi:hypothetical protein